MSTMANNRFDKSASRTTLNLSVGVCIHELFIKPFGVEVMRFTCKKYLNFLFSFGKLVVRLYELYITSVSHDLVFTYI